MNKVLFLRISIYNLLIISSFPCFLSVLTLKNFNTRFCNCYNKNFFFQIKAIATTKKSSQILNDDEVRLMYYKY